MPTLFDPIRLRALEIRNRIWIPPMCQYSVTARDGVPTDWHLVHLGALARGGAGLVIAEATAVTPEGRISAQDTGLWNDDQVAGWHRVTDFIRSQGAASGVQLAHAGRKGSSWPTEAGRAPGSQSVPLDEGGWTTVAPSAVPLEDYADPRALDLAELPGIVAAFRAAARRALDAGFDLVEIHAAHGYLLHQFLSPLSNIRDDAYGGSLENRARLLREVVRAVRAEVGTDVPLLVRVSATDWADGGWDAEQTVEVAGWLRDDGADLFDVSTGGLVGGVTVPLGPGYQVRFAERVAEAGAPTAAVGLIVTPRQAAEVVEQGRADAVLLGRATLRDPHWALRAAHELGVDAAPWPPQYLRARTNREW
ncbi:NADH:flavin oxidoreductase/NADH oxidase [Schumannella luteola]|uniref:2,4-dienoyl-CoA reductase-like NADH-dependent reductase (Old Yellow Enzyme family) n=1 Tax=Schumannella luteola TaxID=472059 RepID=A0A852YCR4_9MICO|nr:2,4-dienoyl-CoA reductase-like NADH-dependent reductase (Old Yellow Enzyme family) [Schumannella luteola]TPX02012.1 NADH:flavin oxidoreductase/NADH oxidase [Schumannella luteola]